MSHPELDKIRNKPFFSKGTLVLLTIMIIGYSFAFARMLTGLGPVTNLNQTFPWGIWIGIDVATGVALAAGGFTTAALINIFGKEKFHPLERPALLTAWLGYSFVGAGLMFDLGRFYNIWHPAIYWQGNSVLFEVGICVMSYLTVLTVEFSPAILGGLLNNIGENHWSAKYLRPLEGPLKKARLVVNRIMPAFVIAGVMFSFMHQSSLGSLMLIAPTKLSSLWWNPLMPVLFLLSAIMVGFPMVIFESLIVTKSFGRKPEMELLTPLSAYIPYTITLYAIVKFATLIHANTFETFFANPGDATALLIEISVGIIIPFFMLIQKSVRKSPLLLFIAVSMIVFGIVLNRVNVFLVGYHPPFATGSYFPAIGEIAVTAALISTIIFIYRFFAVYFPVLEAEDREITEAEKEALKPVKTSMVAWFARGLAVFAFFGFAIFYSVGHYRNFEENQFKEFRFIDPFSKLHAEEPESTLTSFDAEQMPAMISINHKAANIQINDYEPVRFMHKAHASRLNGDCARCHHRVQTESKDRIGEILESSALPESTPADCATCHQFPNEADMLTRPGLKAAFHRQCIECHENETQNAPTDCISCHHPRVPDHTAFIDFKGKPEGKEITARCLECHEKQGQDILDTAHFTWEGLSPNTVGLEHRTDLGKKNIINSYCIHINTNEDRCSQCHIGYGWTDDNFDFTNPENIDCLVCHDKTGTYKKTTTKGGQIAEEVDSLQVARNIGRPTRSDCGSCHFYGGGGANVKHGTLEPALANPSPEMDVHMGKYNMLCQDCHKTREHKIAGQCLTIPASEGRVSCENCHGKTPHNLSGELAVHLDKHAKSVACQTCHIPRFAKETATVMSWDWSKAGQDRETEKDEDGNVTYAKKKGEFTREKNVVPCMYWYNGKNTRHLTDDKIIDKDKTTLLNGPVGNIGDVNSKIAPFKCYTGIVPMDAENKILAIPNLWKGYWDHFDWEKAITKGMANQDTKYSGKLAFAKTEMRWTVDHEVVPADKALHCADCHNQKSVTCTNCHSEGNMNDLSKKSKPLYKGKQINFKDLGYDDDPATIGGRFNKLSPPSFR